jgi:HSP20 family molecular chaperone IbpA
MGLVYLLACSSLACAAKNDQQKNQKKRQGFVQNTESFLGAVKDMVSESMDVWTNFAASFASSTTSNVAVTLVSDVLSHTYVITFELPGFESVDDFTIDVHAHSVTVSAMVEEEVSVCEALVQEAQLSWPRSFTRFVFLMDAVKNEPEHMVATYVDDVLTLVVDKEGQAPSLED